MTCYDDGDGTRYTCGVSARVVGAPRVLCAISLVAAALLCGCLESAAHVCEDGRICPPSTACSALGCVLPEQVTACEGKAEGDSCSYSGVPDGHCVEGVCVSFLCGNGITEEDQGEVCDDGNTDSGDGCRADCRKVEECGDALVDEGESCDDGNENAADGCDACGATRWSAVALLGGSTDATSVGLTFPRGVAIDPRGNVYVADTDAHRVRRIDAETGALTTVAGSGIEGMSGDGGPATSAQLDFPTGLAVDGLGNVYVADTDNHRVRRIAAGDGTITTVVGTGALGEAGDGGLATTAELSWPNGVTVDGLGNLYVADTENHRVRRVDAATGIIVTVAGGGDALDNLGDGGDATDAELFLPTSVAVTPAGDLFIADSGHQRIRRVDAGTGTITTFAGGGPPDDDDGDGGPATAAALYNPYGLALRPDGVVLVADTDNERIRQVSAGGIITTVAGTGLEGFSGDGGPAVEADVSGPVSVAVDANGDIVLADTDNHRVRRVDADTGTISTLAGSGDEGVTGDGGAATSAVLVRPRAIAVSEAGDVYVGFEGRVRRIDGGTGVLTTVAGGGTQGDSGDGRPATRARLSVVEGVALDNAGNLYLSDTFNDRIRRVDVDTGVITNVAGTGAEGFSGDGGLATSAELNDPTGIAIAASGELFFADSRNHTVRRVDTDGVITTVAGTGVPGDSGDGDLADAAQLRGPTDVAVDADGHLYVADSGNHRVRRVDADSGLIATVAGTGTAGFSDEDEVAVLAALDDPLGVAVDGGGHLFIADHRNQRVRRVDAVSGLIATVVGTGAANFLGDGGPATAAALRFPHDIAIRDDGDLYIADFVNHLVRRVRAGTDVITTVGGHIDPAGMGPLPQARLADPRALVLSPGLTLFAGGATGTLQAMRDDGDLLEVVAGRYPQSTATGNLARFRTAAFGTVTGVAYDEAAGRIYLTESSAHRVHVVTVPDPANEQTWTISTLAGDGTAGFADGAAALARFRNPAGLYLDHEDDVLYVADAGNHVIRAIDIGGGDATVSTVAGTPQTIGVAGDGGPATEALLFAPGGLTRCPGGDLFIADTRNHRVRRIDASNVITTVLGDGVPASSGEGAPASAFPVDRPLGLACDAAGNLYVTSSTALRVLAANDDGVVDGDGAVNTIFGASPRVDFPATVTFCLAGVAVLDADTVQAVDSCTGMLIELTRERSP